MLVVFGVCPRIGMWGRERGPKERWGAWKSETASGDPAIHAELSKSNCNLRLTSLPCSYTHHCRNLSLPLILCLCLRCPKFPKRNTAADRLGVLEKEKPFVSLLEFCSFFFRKFHPKHRNLIRRSQIRHERGFEVVGKTDGYTAVPQERQRGFL